VLLEVLLGGGHELDGDELVAAALEAEDDFADETALSSLSANPHPRNTLCVVGYTWTPSGLIAMKLFLQSVPLHRLCFPMAGGDERLLLRHGVCLLLLFSDEELLCFC